jgi:hypothetical protein
MMKGIAPIFMTFVLAASSVFARQPIQYPTPVDYNPPTVTQCIAYGYLNQRCQQCVTTVVNGVPQEYQVCQFSTTRANCACTFNPRETVGCTGAIGDCIYY